jgi:hypothetical protein
MLNVVPKIVPIKSLVSLLNSELAIEFKSVVEGNVEVTQGPPTTTFYVGLSMPRAWMLCMYRDMLEEHESLLQACSSLNEDLLTFVISYDCQVPANVMTESSALFLELRLNLRMHWFACNFVWIICSKLLAANEVSQESWWLITAIYESEGLMLCDMFLFCYMCCGVVGLRA